MPFTFNAFMTYIYNDSFDDDDSMDENRQIEIIPGLFQD